VTEIYSCIFIYISQLTAEPNIRLFLNLKNILSDVFFFNHMVSDAYSAGNLTFYQVFICIHIIRLFYFLPKIKLFSIFLSLMCCLNWLKVWQNHGLIKNIFGSKVEPLWSMQRESFKVKYFCINRNFRFKLFEMVSNTIRLFLVY